MENNNRMKQIVHWFLTEISFDIAKCFKNLYAFFYFFFHHSMRGWEWGRRQYCSAKSIINYMYLCVSMLIIIFCLCESRFISFGLVSYFSHPKNLPILTNENHKENLALPFCIFYIIAAFSSFLFLFVWLHFNLHC